MRQDSLKRALYLVAAEGAREAARPYFADALERIGFRIDTLSIAPSSSIGRAGCALLAPRRFAAYDLVVVSEYFIAWGCALRALLEGCSTKLIVVGLNQSRRLIRFRQPTLERFNRSIWNRFDQVVVSSRAEAHIFARVHGIDPAKFTFIHWGYDLPQTHSDRFAGRTAPYVCMIGRNNRDVDAFCRAVAAAGVHGVLVSPLKPTVAADAAIEYFPSLSLEDCLSCIRNALANVMLITDESRGAGHITAVNSMFLGVPQIFSRAATIEDYVIDGYNGIAVPIGSHVEVATAIRELASNPALRTRLGENGRAFAQGMMTNAIITDKLKEVVRYLFGEIPKPEQTAWYPTHHDQNENSISGEISPESQN